MTTVHVSAEDQPFATLLGAAIRRRSGHPIRIARTRGNPAETRLIIDELATTDVVPAVKRTDWKGRDWKGTVALRFIHAGATTRFRLKAKGGLWNGVEPVPRRHAIMARDLARQLLPVMSKLVPVRAPKDATVIVFGASRGYDENATLAKLVAGQLRGGGWKAKPVPHELELRTKCWARVWFGHVALRSDRANVRVHVRIAGLPVTSKSVRLKYDSDTTGDADALAKLAAAVTEHTLKVFSVPT
jgi:hypothetical protein